MPHKQISSDVFMYTGGLQMHHIDSCSPGRPSIWPLLFSQPLSRGRHTRLRIWDEQACLILPPSVFIFFLSDRATCCLSRQKPVLNLRSVHCMRRPLLPPGFCWIWDKQGENRGGGGEFSQICVWQTCDIRMSVTSDNWLNKLIKRTFVKISWEQD